MRFDLPLFLELNEEYRCKPIVPAPPQYDPASLAERSAKKAAAIDKKVPLRDRRVLEIGCGRGEVCRLMAERYRCSTVGVDVARYHEWSIFAPDVQLLQMDMSQEDTEDLGMFDLIYSNSVWEHVRHPFAMLKAAHRRLASKGDFLLSANLFRGPKASHRYREVFFPWPHLLFSDDVFHDFYTHLARQPEPPGAVAGGTGHRSAVAWRNGPAWVNQLSIADYLRYFTLAGFETVDVRFSITPIDEAFYRRFADQLERFPRYDLERDFIHAHLRKAT